MKKLSSGAEAVLYFDSKHNVIVKDRISKSYRNDELDLALRKSRNNREKKVLEKLKGIIPVPSLVEPNVLHDGKNKTKTVFPMSYINGKKLSECLSNTNYKYIFKKIGKYVALMHNLGIIHADLTTSNLILKDDSEVYFIDFGLSFFSDKIEDKAVDIHLLRQALESRHPEIWEDAFSTFVSEYKKHSNTSKDTLNRFEQVEQRGRNKKK